MILLIVGASVDFAGARGTRLKNAALENMWRLRRRKLKLKKPLRLKRRKKLKTKLQKRRKMKGLISCCGLTWDDWYSNCDFFFFI